MSFLYEQCSLCELKRFEQIEQFDCGDKDLNDFFTKDCFAYAKQLLGKTYCYRVKEDVQQVVCAFTLANAGIRVSDLPNARRKKVESNIPHVKTLKDYPAVLVARLGVSKDFRSLHIGSDVIRYIKYWFLEPYNKTGCRYVLVDAYNNPDTMAFYQNNGFSCVFSSEQQEQTYRHVDKSVQLSTRLMFFDLMQVVMDTPFD